MDKKGSVIAPNDHPHLYKVFNEKGNLIITNCHHLIPTNEKFIVKHNYDNTLEPRETALQKTAVQARTDIYNFKYYQNTS